MRRDLATEVTITDKLIKISWSVFFADLKIAKYFKYKMVNSLKKRGQEFTLFDKYCKCLRTF